MSADRPSPPGAAPGSEPWNVVVATGEQHFDEHDLTVRWTAYEYRLEFRVQQGTKQPDGSICYMYFPSDAVSNEPTDDFDTAHASDPFIRGTVKWDGCSHVNFGDQNGYLHLCGVRNFRALAFILGEVFRIAGREVPAFDASCANLTLAPELAAPSPERRV